ncbi:MAG: ORF2 [XiangYun mono-chu-like virus 11]|nr:MAG: ORF2 [XiangYun mono-chu-like virus 11]
MCDKSIPNPFENTVVELTHRLGFNPNSLVKTENLKGLSKAIRDQVEGIKVNRPALPSNLKHQFQKLRSSPAGSTPLPTSSDGSSSDDPDMTTPSGSKKPASKDSGKKSQNVDPKKKSADPPPPPGGQTQMSFVVDVQNPVCSTLCQHKANPPVFSLEDLCLFVESSRLPGQYSMSRLYLGMWQVTEAFISVKESGDKLKDHCRDLYQQKLELSDQLRDAEHKNRLDASRMATLDEHLTRIGLEFSDMKERYEIDKVKLTQLSAMTTTEREEVHRADVYRLLCERNPELSEAQWIDLDYDGPYNLALYPVFKNEEGFVNPYRTCQTESDVLEANRQIQECYPYMTIMTMALQSLPEQVKGNFIRELKSARDPLSFFLSLNAIAKMSPIIMQSLRVYRDLQERSDRSKLSESISAIEKQMSLTQTTMGIFLDQTEIHRNSLISTAKYIKTFTEKFPETLPVPPTPTQLAPAVLWFKITVGKFTLMITGHTPGNAVVKLDAKCLDIEKERRLSSMLKLYLKPLFTLLRDEYFSAATKLVEAILLMDPDFVDDGVFLKRLRI